MVASDVAEQRARTRYESVAAPGLPTLANQPRDAAPAAVEAGTPPASRGWVVRTTAPAEDPTGSTPPPVALPAGHATAAPCVSPAGTAIGASRTTASDVAEQKAATRYSASPCDPARRTYQPRATSPASVFSGCPVSSTGPLACTSLVPASPPSTVPSPGSRRPSMMEKPPPVARRPAGHIAAISAGLPGSARSRVNTGVASPPGAASARAATRPAAAASAARASSATANTPCRPCAVTEATVCDDRARRQSPIAGAGITAPGHPARSRIWSPRR